MIDGVRGTAEPRERHPPRRPVPRGPTSRRRRHRLSVTLAVVVTVVVLVLTYGTGGGGGTGRPTAGRSGHSTRTAGARHDARGGSTTASSPPTSAATATTTSTTSPGTLPQTSAFPSSSTPQFLSEMADLWHGIVTGIAGPAMPAFFPLGAYLQLKAIPNAGTDWRERLVGAYEHDIAAAHALLGTGAAAASLVAVNVPSQYGHWVTPGVCYNTIGYYEMPNARVVYTVGGVTKSFGIASMISWRGEWYVVHLGAVLRSTPGEGLVDGPATGPGTSAYSSTC